MWIDSKLVSHQRFGEISSVRKDHLYHLLIYLKRHWELRLYIRYIFCYMREHLHITDRFTDSLTSSSTHKVPSHVSVIPAAWSRIAIYFSGLIHFQYIWIHFCVLLETWKCTFPALFFMTDQPSIQPTDRHTRTWGFIEKTQVQNVWHCLSCEYILWQTEQLTDGHTWKLKG